MNYVPEPELTWADIQKAIETASWPVYLVTDAVARVPLGPGSRVRVRSTVKNEGEFDNVEDYAGASGTVTHYHDDAEYEWCVTLDGQKYSTEFHTHELEEAA